MPITFEYDSTETIDLDEFKNRFAKLGCRPSDTSSLEMAAPLLRQLGNNKEFVFEAMSDKLLAIANGDKFAPETGQVLGIDKIDDFFSVRAVVWPSEDDELLQKTGPDLFYYEKAHDHNFSFLTIGYWGPGYVSDYFEVDMDERGANDLHVGQPVNLKHTGLHTLLENKMMLYRAYIDVHSQMYPESMSISLNIIANPPINALTSQYLYDTDLNKVNSIYQSRTNYGIFRNALDCNIDDAEGMLLHISENHEDGLTRYFAIKTLADNKFYDVDRLKSLCNDLKHTDRYAHGMLSEYLRPLV